MEKYTKEQEEMMWDKYYTDIQVLTMTDDNNITKKSIKQEKGIFSGDIKDGIFGEEVVKNFLIHKKEGIFIRQSDPNNLQERKEWDLMFNFPDTIELNTIVPHRGIILYEVKNEVYIISGKDFTFKTPLGKIKTIPIPGRDKGNLFIEFEYGYNNEPSGIQVTKSDVWVSIILAKNEIWFIEVDKLKELIENSNFEIKINYNKKTPSKGYAIPREKFKHHFLVEKIK